MFIQKGGDKMSHKKEYSIVTVVSNLTKSEAMDLKTALMSKANKITPNAKYFASTGDGSNIAKAISNYESRRITKK